MRKLLLLLSVFLCFGFSIKKTQILCSSKSYLITENNGVYHVIHNGSNRVYFDDASGDMPQAVQNALNNCNNEN